MTLEMLQYLAGGMAWLILLRYLHGRVSNASFAPTFIMMTPCLMLGVLFMYLDGSTPELLVNLSFGLTGWLVTGGWFFYQGYTRYLKRQENRRNRELERLSKIWGAGED